MRLVACFLTMPLLALLALAGPTRAAETAEAGKPIIVFAAASTTNAVDEVIGLFREQTGVKVQTSYASSSMLAQQIIHGADADVFISADTKWADYLSQRGLVAKRRELLGNRLVVVVPADSKLAIKGLDDLLAAEIEHLALGDPSGVPAGKYAKQALGKLGLWSKIEGKVVPAENVRHALAFVETGAAEAGIVYATDAAVSKKVKVALEIPAKLSEPIRYPVVLLKDAEGKAAAESFYRYLASPEAAKVFTKHGFALLDEGKNRGK